MSVHSPRQKGVKDKEKWNMRLNPVWILNCNAFCTGFYEERYPWGGMTCDSEYRPVRSQVCRINIANAWAIEIWTSATVYVNVTTVELWTKICVIGEENRK